MKMIVVVQNALMVNVSMSVLLSQQAMHIEVIKAAVTMTARIVNFGLMGKRKMNKNIFYLTKQLPKLSKKTMGYLDVDSKTKRAMFWTENDKCIADMESVQIKCANTEVIILSGFEPAGLDRTGRGKFKYQEWVLRFV